MASKRLDPSLLSTIPLFQGTPARELERLAPLLHERVFPAGATVLMAEQPGEAVYFLADGSVKVHAIRPDGAEVILAVLGPGEVVGEMSSADSLGRSGGVRRRYGAVLRAEHLDRRHRNHLHEVPGNDLLLA